MLDEAAFRQLLDCYHASANEGERRQNGDALVAAILVHWDRELRPLLAREFRATKGDTSVRYSAMVSRFFEDILKKSPDEIWRAKSLHALTRFASRVISNDILDVLRRRRTREKQHPDAPLEFAEHRLGHFRARHELDLECVLRQLALWDLRPEPWPLRARVIRFRYLDAMEYAEIAAQEGLLNKAIYRAKEEAIEELRRTCGEDANLAGIGGVR